MEEKYILYFVLVIILAFMLKSQNEPFFIEELNVLALNNSWKNQVHQGSGFLGAFRNGPEDIYLSDDGAIQVSLGRDAGPLAKNAIWVSKDTGVTWSIIANETSPNLPKAFCMSGNGKFFYLMSNGFVYLSTDHGLTLSQATEIKSYYGGSICCSQNGQYVFANSGNSAPSLSRDYGKTFTVMKGGGIGPVCMSDNGSRLFSYSRGESSDTGIHYSHDNGLTWKWSSTWETISAYENIGHMTCDGTGTHILINSGPYQSLDGGKTFNKITLLNKIYDNNWGRIAISKSGQYLSTINGYTKEIWESDDYGISWKVVQNESSYLPLVLQPNVVAISRNGLVYVARMTHLTHGLHRDKAIMRQMIRGPSDTQPQPPRKRKK
jgi:hypothetical protein